MSGGQVFKFCLMKPRIVCFLAEINVILQKIKKKETLEKEVIAEQTGKNGHRRHIVMYINIDITKYIHPPIFKPNLSYNFGSRVN